MRDFNFFSSYNTARQNSQKRVVSIAALAVFALFMVFAAFTANYIYDLRLNAVRLEIESNKLILSNPNTLAAAEQYSLYYSQLGDLKIYNQKVLQLSEQVDDGALINTAFLKSIERNITGGTTVNLLSVTSNTVNITGTSGSEVSIARFERGMSGEGFVESVFVSNISRGGLGFEFTMSVTMKEVAGNVENQ